MGLKSNHSSLKFKLESSLRVETRLYREKLQVFLVTDKLWKKFDYNRAVDPGPLFAASKWCSSSRRLEPLKVVHYIFTPDNENNYGTALF